MKNYRKYTIGRIPSLKVLDFQKIKKKVKKAHFYFHFGKEREEANQYIKSLQLETQEKIINPSTISLMEKKEKIKVFLKFSPLIFV